MAKARKCDICGAYYDEYNTGSYAKEPNTLFFVRKDCYGNNDTAYSFDCCQSCMTRVLNQCKNYKKESED